MQGPFSPSAPATGGCGRKGIATASQRSFLSRPRLLRRIFTAAAAKDEGGKRPKKRKIDPQAAKWLKFDSLLTSQPASRAVDAARSLQARFVAQHLEFTKAHVEGESTRSLVGKVMLQFCKGYLELQRAYCDAKARLVLDGAAAHATAAADAVSRDDAGFISTAGSPFDMVLQDMLHLMLLGVMPTPQQQGGGMAPSSSSGPGGLSASPASPAAASSAAASGPRRLDDGDAFRRQGAAARRLLLQLCAPPSAGPQRRPRPETEGGASTAGDGASEPPVASRTSAAAARSRPLPSSSSLPSPGSAPRPAVPLFEPMCVKALDVGSTLRSTGALAGPDSLTSRQLLHTSMYWLMR